MNFFRKIKDSAGKMTDRAQNVVEIGRLNTQIANIEREMGLYYQKMGEVFYEGYRLKDMSEAEKEMLELAKTCDLLVEERDEVRLKIAELKNERLCGTCGKNVAQDAMFCPYCGASLRRAVRLRIAPQAD
ncbi:zinc ribbon domain-containing protein [Paenibacillus sp. D2_2]|uniref:zinc ribbon domain-containing protein n=1 Tax=Paenibacillus sp. D2_2 TaxID=3073092 RepID=UPI0028152268|nr:zinc ribbon domain-containing protein [Paenibacillus sp. D2_2]WMT41551.1 zinc ribbon domain-containing protein [Paenibacillus sp. D2_2]